MEKLHYYRSIVTWEAGDGPGTRDYKAYSRNHEISAKGKAAIPASSDPSFRGDASRYSPEDLLVSALSSCHMLWYLHLCAVNGVVVVKYTDQPVGEMSEHPDGSGEFRKVTLFPKVTITDASMVEKAQSLHTEAHRRCFIARSMNFPVHHKPAVTCLEKA